MDMLDSGYFLIGIESDPNTVDASQSYRYINQRSPNWSYVFAVARVNNNNFYAPNEPGKFIYVDFQDLSVDCVLMNIYDLVYLLDLLLANPFKFS